MKPIFLLMAEHRIIERVVRIMNEEAELIRKGKKASPDLISDFVRFFREYADHIHHGKEEDILFRELAKKSMSDEHKQIMQKLLDDHTNARKAIGTISDLNLKYRNGDDSAVAGILDAMNLAGKLYPPHIELEDRHFFHPSMDYFSSEEQEKMAEECIEFDKTKHPEEYRKIAEQLGKMHPHSKAL